MRIPLLAAILVATLAPLAGCSGTGDNWAAVQAMNNPPNTCGPGGSRNIEDCRGRP
jgi:hypothetical protein